MRLITYCIAGLLVPLAATAQIHLCAGDQVTLSGYGLDSAGIQQTPDSVRVIVLRHGAEVHDEWYDAADEQCAALNGGLAFSDAFGDLDNDAGPGLYEVRAGYFLHDDSLYDWRSLWVYLGVDLAAIEDTVRSIKDILDVRESWNLAGRVPIGDTIHRSASVLTEDSNIGVDWSDIINTGAQVGLTGTSVLRLNILDEDLTTIDLDGSAVGRVNEKTGYRLSSEGVGDVWSHSPRTLSGLGFALDSLDFAGPCFNQSHFTAGFFDSARGVAGGAGAGDGAFSVALLAVDTLAAQTVPGVRVSIRNVEQTSLLAVGRTDPSGRVTFNLDSGDFLIVADAPGYLFAPFDTLTVTGPELDSIPGRRFDPGTPASPSLCRVYGFVYDVSGLPEAGVAASACLPKGVSRTDELIVSPGPITTITDTTGYFCLDLIPSVLMESEPKYELTVTRSDGTILRKRVAVPTQSSWALTW